METNSQQIQERAERLEKHGVFRVWKHKERLGRRVFEPSWSHKVHEARTINNAFVQDEHGDEYPTKEVLPIPKESTELPEPPAKLNPKARGLLQRYANRLKAFLTTQEDHRTAASKAHRVLSQVGEIKEAVQLAGLSTKSVIASFVSVFPECKLETPKKGGAAYVSLAA